MDVQSNVRGVVARLSASPDGLDNDAAGAKSATTVTPNGIRSSPPVLVQDIAMDVDPPNNSLENGGDKSDSEAETIVLPGKDGHSPSKIRKSIKHEDKSEDEEMTSAPDVKGSGLDIIQEDETQGGGKHSESATANSMLGKRKRQKHGNHKDDTTHHGNSSGLSSVPTSPAAATRSSLSKHAASDSDISKSPSPRPRSAVRDKAKSVDRALPRKKRYDHDSGDEDDIEERRSVRQRSSGTKPSIDAKSRKDTGSTSPQARSHRRSISTQLPAKSSYGLSHKKKRVPAPLQSTEYQSDDSSASGSSYPRSSRLRSLAAPNTGDSTISPVKMGSHKKHVNSSGQTLLARACGSNKLDLAIQRYEERPEDLNETDHAGNAPLHSASINGHAEVVKFLLSTGNCIVDPLNIQKDTPLHDALENCYVNVVKLLLDAGANPRKPKGDGKDPLDIIAEKEIDDEDDEERLAEWAAMKDLITAAIKKPANIRQDSEDDRIQDNADSRLSHPTESPRHTPPVPSHEFPSMNTTTRRVGVGTSRQVKTKDGNLYQPMNLAELRKAARDGDSDTTTRILEVMPNTNDPKTLWLAARGGHKDVMEFQLAMGKFDPDPAPLEDVEPGKDTPFLVAIGRGNHLPILRLLLAQNRFDPTRVIDGETYYEIARKRKGPNWQEEVTLLKEAFDNHKKSPKSSPGKSRSPGLRRDMRDGDRDGRRSLRRDEQQPSRSHKRSTSSPKTKESESSLTQHRSNSTLDHSKDGQTTKRGPGRPRKEENLVVVTISDRESSPLGPPKPKSQTKKSESDIAVASDNETATKPRRKLISGKEYRGERDLEKQRRASVASNASSASVKDKRERGPPDSKPEKLDGRASPTVPRATSKHGEHDLTSDKHPMDKDRARSLKRDDSKDRLSAIRGESPVKRPRKSETPPRSIVQEISSNYSASGGAPKRRKLEGDPSRNTDSTPSSSPEHHTTKPKSSLSRENSTAKSNTDSTNKPSRSSKGHSESAKEGRKHSVPSDQQNRSTKSGMLSHSSTPELPGKTPRPTNAGTSEKTAEELSSAIKSNKEEAAREARIRREKEERDAIRKREEEERQEAARIEEAKQARLAREQAAREEEAKREREEAERKERQRIEDMEARNRAIEEQRALYLEQERLKREEQERRRAIAQEQQRAEKARLEKVKREERLSKLPLLLRWFDLVDDPKTPEIASLFRSIPGYRYDTIKPELTGQTNAREQWMLNTHVATLLGERDLQLSRYTAWERIPLTNLMKRGVWKTQNDWFTLRNFALPLTLRRHFLTNGVAPHTIVEQNRSLFLELELFFVKVSEFMFIVPNFPHLRGVEMEVQYRELVLPLSQPGPMPTPKWKSDPDIDPNQTFLPRSKYYINGELFRNGQTHTTRILNAPPPGDDRVPRRGLVRVYPGESDYEDICKQQGLHHFLPGNQISPSSSTNPQMGELDHRPQQMNGFTPPGSDVSKSINGGSPHRGSISEVQAIQQLPNGISEHSGSPTDTAPHHTLA